MANQVYDKFMDALGTKLIDLTNDTLEVILVDVGVGHYQFSQTHEFLSSIVVGDRYGTPQALANVTLSAAILDADDVQIPAVSGPTCEAAVIYWATGNDATARLFCYIDSAGGSLPVILNGGPVDLRWNASGIVKL